MDRTREFQVRDDESTPFIGWTRPVINGVKRAAWRANGKYIGVFHSRSYARQILNVDAKLAANEGGPQ